MYCPKCGWNNPDNASKCANCFADMRAQAPQQPAQTQQMPQQLYVQQPMPQQPYQPSSPQQGYNQQPYAGGPVSPVNNVPDYLIWAILTIFCCLPLGIVAIIKAVQSNNKKAIGDYYGALQDSYAAKTWTIWAFGVGIAAWLVSIAFTFMVILSANSSGNM